MRRSLSQREHILTMGRYHALENGVELVESYFCGALKALRTLRDSKLIAQETYRVMLDELVDAREVVLHGLTQEERIAA